MLTKFRIIDHLTHLYMSPSTNYSTSKTTAVHSDHSFVLHFRLSLHQSLVCRYSSNSDLMCYALFISITFCSQTSWSIRLTCIVFSDKQNTMCARCLPRWHRPSSPAQYCTVTATFPSATVLRFIRSLDVMALIMHALRSMCMHSCLKTCLRENVRLNHPPRVYRQACKQTCEYTCVRQWSPCVSQPRQYLGEKSKRVCSCVLIYAFVRVWAVFQGRRVLPLT